MTLRAFQAALSHMVRSPDRIKPDTFERQAERLELSTTEEEALRSVVSSTGLELTREIRRSWSRGRAYRAAPATLAAIPVDQRDAVLEEWISANGSSSSFPEGEAERLLEFIERRLRDPSPERIVCEIELASYRAARAAPSSPCESNLVDLRRLNTWLAVSPHASLMRIQAGPAGTPPTNLPELDATQSAELHPWILIAPGIEGGVRHASDPEVTILKALATPRPIAELDDLASDMESLMESLRELLRICAVTVIISADKAN